MIQTKERTDHRTYSGNGERPQFRSPAQGLQHVEAATRHGHRPWEPATRAELLLADEVGLLEAYPQWIPCRVGLRLLDLPDSFGRTLEPFTERFKERFLSTLYNDTAFATAVLNLIRGEG